ncbi:ABC transporter permease [Paenibacillus thalictri]|uniref:ABC transporter permease n=1 Tax=Paenibacillus thalictri TaxID=2527873 RepID=A0A4Q9DXH4_9BACL|nr:ABC-2 family transporter protein [Paenibacillus thalictri]TBL81827.1 hypothetical protein EYB31_02225 [Paenibacillus thalictri]
MLTAVNTIRFVLTCWKLNLAGAMEFRISFLLTAGMMILNNTVWVLFWGVYFHRFPVVNGWDFRDVMMMWAISAGGFGLAASLFGNAFRLSSLVAGGQLDIYMAQPKPVLLSILVSRMSVSAIGDFLFAVILFVMFGQLTAAGLLKFALALAITMTIYIFFMVIVHSLAFYMGNAEGIGQQMLNAVLAFATYPTNIFKGLGKLMLFTVIPAGFISYLPIGLIKRVELPFLFGALGMAAALALLATWFFYTGLRRYSSGNMISLRM